ncbi:hypothetical protein MED222_06110 [Vibrio sp. MED222]|nr:hypothetical protein MED222_06110 [Vibrio sp. MED222]
MATQLLAIDECSITIENYTFSLF